MKKTLLLCFVIFVSVFLNVPNKALAFSGSGTSGDPWQITSCADLEAMDDDINYVDDYFVLTQDISCSAYAHFEPIGTSTTAWYSSDGFSGQFDGQNHTISDLVIQTGDYSSDVGLFTIINGGTIKNLTLHNGSVSGGDRVGAVVGYADYDGTIENVHSDLLVTGTGGGIGGLVGEVDNYNLSGQFSMTDSSSSGDIVGDGYTGGLIGNLVVSPDYTAASTNTIFNNNEFTGTVEGTNAGGLIGYFEIYNYNSDYTIDVSVSGNVVHSSSINAIYDYSGGAFGYINIINRYSGDTINLTISSTTVDVDLVTGGIGGSGGLIGNLESSTRTTGITTNIVIEKSDVFADIPDANWAGGGIVGSLYLGNFYASSNHSLDFSKNRFFGDISNSGEDTGGLIGLLSTNGPFTTNKVSQCYASSTITSTSASSGGLIGEVDVDGNTFVLEDSYFKGSVSGTTKNGGLIGATNDYSEGGGLFNINTSYAVGSVTGSGNDNGGLIGYNYASSTVNLKSLFAAATVGGGSNLGTVLGNNVGTANFESVVFDQAKNSSLTCVGNQTVSGCTAVNTTASPDSDYFFNSSTNPPFTGGSLTWDFSSVWYKNTYDYPTLTIFGASSVTGSGEDDSGGSSGEEESSDDGDSDDSVVTSSSRSGGRSGSARHYGCKDSLAENYEKFVTHKQELCVYKVASISTDASTSNTSGNFQFSKDLEFGMISEDVLVLQKLLNSKGFIVSTTGGGSIGNETTYFGEKTKAALIKFQIANNISPTLGYFGPKTRAFVSK